MPQNPWCGARRATSGTWRDRCRTIAAEARRRALRIRCHIAVPIGGQSHAAPRTPLESPCTAFRIGVEIVSEKIYPSIRPGRFA